MLDSMSIAAVESWHLRLHLAVCWLPCTQNASCYYRCQMARVSHMRRLSRVLLYMLISGLVVLSGVREWLLSF
jgi:hypothetical protein